MRQKKASKRKAPAPAAMTAHEELPDKPAVWVPGRDAIGEGEALQYDPTAYDCMSSMTLEWPSLSFDIIRDSLGDARAAFPHTLSVAAGTQAPSTKQNYLAVVKVSNLSAERAAQRRPGAASDNDDDDDDEMNGDDDDDDEDGEQADEARLHVRRVAHTGGVNRVRAMPQRTGIVASWADTAQVQVWDLAAQLEELAAEAEPVAGAARVQRVPARQVHAHSAEGFALDWSPVAEARLASGDCRARIHVWEPAAAGRWAVGPGLKGHEGSVEDLQWSPTEGTVFASASVDRTIRIWDTREPSKPMITVQAHQSDVNVISWNRSTAYMLASGGDDCALRVWDLRQFAPGGAPVADFAHHRGAVTSVEWSPHEPSVLCTTSADNTACVWDLALERDPEEEEALAPESNAAAPADLPPQLLFVHAGQADPKEAHWHPQIPGLLITTAADGFNLFKPANV